MRAFRYIHCIAAALLLAALLAVVVCSGMATVAAPTAQTMPADCPLHPHHGHNKPAACCTVNQRNDALTESQVKLPELADLGHVPPVLNQVEMVLPVPHVVVASIASPPPQLIAIRI